MATKDLNYKQAFYELNKLKNKSKAEVFRWFFKTGKGEYGEGDKFLGLTSPEIQKIAKKFTDLQLEDVKKLLLGKFHEERMLGARILVLKFEKGDESERKKIFDFYLLNSKLFNNWDLVDVSCYKILGPMVKSQGDDFLIKLSQSPNLWQKRISIVSTFFLIQKGKYDLTFKIARKLIDEKHDLLHKATGWKLREVGKRCGDEYLLRYISAAAVLERLHVPIRYTQRTTPTIQ
jgi:3-methyladenine DNA glycosylase AlkD